MTDRKWEPPKLGQGDYLIEADVVETDGTRTPIVLASLLHGDGSRTIMGYSRSLDLPPGASVEFKA